MAGTSLPGGLLFVCWCRNDAELPHHTQIISHRPVFDGFAVPEAHEMHVGLLKGTTGRRYPLKRTQMGTPHGHMASDSVTFGHQVLNREMQIGEGRAQHPDDLPR